MTRTVNDMEPRDAPSVPTPIAALLVVLSLLVAGAAWVAANRHGGPAPIPPTAPAAGSFREVLPPSLAGLPVTTHLTGREAVDAVMGLHIGEVPVDAAEIADYGGGRVQVSVSWTTAEPAPALVARMTERIGAGDTPFLPPHRVRRLPGVWTTSGNGQTHYYFAREGGVWWLGADPALADDAVVELLEVAG